MSFRSSTKSARLETRVSQEQKELIERPASCTGCTVSDFVIAHVEMAAKQVVEEYERLHLNKEQSRIVVEALLSPNRPNKQLCKAIKDFHNRVAGQ